MKNNWINKTSEDGSFLLELQRIGSALEINNQLKEISIKKDLLQVETELLRTNSILQNQKEVRSTEVIINELSELREDTRIVMKKCCLDKETEDAIKLLQHKNIIDKDF